jgi:ATP-dependent exoDNAse (exonuclease V) alpha subunit
MKKIGLFKVGDVLMFKSNEEHLYTVKNGAIGICLGYSRSKTTKSTFVDIKWIRDELVGDQKDGGYWEEDFEKLEDTKYQLSVRIL